MREVMVECVRVLKPGAHGLVWALPRTSHWTATALEDAGFEVRDRISHLFGQGFPKSLDISKAISSKLDVPSTQWDGWGTALKPACEDWWLVRKPCSEKTVAENVLKWGVGGINIDYCRIEPSTDYGRSAANAKGTVNAHNGFDGKAFKIAERDGEYASPLGRFPANLVLSHSLLCTDEQCDEDCAVYQLDTQSLAGGMHAAGKARDKKKYKTQHFGIGQENTQERETAGRFGDTGGASRFFYCAKISSSERNAGLEGLPDKVLAMSNAAIAAEKRGETERVATSGVNSVKVVKNHHPTVKPQKLMRYLCRLLTPPKGTVLDPFMGSGSTGVAAIAEGFNFIGVEKEQDYFEIAEQRIKNAKEKEQSENHAVG